MPIQLSNHRTSNAKLFSVSNNKQKLHTASSFQQTHKANIRLSKNHSGSGLAMVSRMFSNPTNEKPSRNRRRHSMTGSLGGDSVPANIATSTSTSPTIKKGMRRTGSLDTTLLAKTTHVPSPSRSASHGDRRRSSTTSSSSKKKNVKRSQSFENKLSFVGITPTAPIRPLTMDMLSDSQRRRAMRRRGSGDSAATAPFNHGQQIPESPRETLRAKRDQLRRKSLSSLPVMECTSTPTSMLHLMDDPYHNNLSDDSADEEDDSDDDSLAY